MSSRRARILVAAVGTTAIAAAVAAVTIVSASSEPYYPEEGLNEHYADLLVRDLTAEDPLTELAGDFRAADRDELRALIAQCRPATEAHPEPTVYADVVPVNARVILDAPGFPRCDAHLSWVEAEGEDWAVRRTPPSPQDPLARPDTTPADESTDAAD